MTKAPLGRFEQVDLRDYWSNEAAEFTPWLAQAENLSILGQAIGMELEVVQREKPVGPFSADLLCRNTADGSYVVIENQLERTDHSHMGQLLTYAAGLDAGSLVWIARQFTDEHRAALDWLNRVTGEGANFFGIEIELWQIDDSRPAPRFNVVCLPNDWSKSAAEPSTPSQTGKAQVQYWEAFRDFAAQAGANVAVGKPQPQNWMSSGIGRSGFSLAAVASRWNNATNQWAGETRVELVIHNDPDRACFALLQQEREQIELEVGAELTWYSVENVRSCRIYARKDAPVEDPADWPRQHAWLLETLQRFKSAFEDRVKALPRPL